MVFFLLVCEEIPVSDVFFTLILFFLFHSKHNRYLQKQNTVISKPEMIPKELENSHLSSFSVYLTDIFKIIAKCRRKVISKYRKKSLFIA